MFMETHRHTPVVSQPSHHQRHMLLFLLSKQARAAPVGGLLNAVVAGAQRHLGLNDGDQAVLLQIESTKLCR